MSTKLKCLLLDDELPGLTYLKMLCEQIIDIEVVKTFNDPVLLLNEQSFLDYDFCIMDIEMPSMKCDRLLEAYDNHYSIMGPRQWSELMKRAGFKILGVAELQFKISINDPAHANWEGNEVYEW